MHKNKGCNPALVTNKPKQQPQPPPSLHALPCVYNPEKNDRIRAFILGFRNTYRMGNKYVHTMYDDTDPLSNAFIKQVLEAITPPGDKNVGELLDGSVFSGPLLIASVVSAAF